MKKTIVISGLFILLLSACGPSAEQQSAMTATAETATAAAWTPTPTNTATPTITPTATPTLTPTATNTPRPTNTPAFTPSPTSTQDPNRFYAADGTFSIMIPPGWEVVDAGMDYPNLVADPDVSGSPGIFFFTAESDFPVEWWAAGVQDSMAQRLDVLNTISEDFLTTADGRNYFRWEFESTQSGISTHSVCYFFENGSWKLVISYSRLAGRDSETDAVVEQAITTLQFGG